MTCCKLCGIPISGRSDKEFCGQACRNAYHNAKVGQPSSRKEKTATTKKIPGLPPDFLACAFHELFLAVSYKMQIQQILTFLSLNPTQLPFEMVSEINQISEAMSREDLFDLLKKQNEYIKTLVAEIKQNKKSESTIFEANK